MEFKEENNLKAISYHRKRSSYRSFVGEFILQMANKQNILADIYSFKFILENLNGNNTKTDEKIHPRTRANCFSKLFFWLVLFKITIIVFVIYIIYNST